MKKFLVWREDDERGDAMKIEALYEKHAATKWAEITDSKYADYTIVGGQEERVFVAEYKEGSTPILSTAYGETIPVYGARLETEGAA